MEKASHQIKKKLILYVFTSIPFVSLAIFVIWRFSVWLQVGWNGIVALKFCTEFLVALIYFILGFFVYQKKSQDSRALLFFLVTFVVSLALMLHGLMRVYPEATLAGALVMVFVFLLGPLCLHFALIFPSKRPLIKNRRGLVKWIYGFSVSMLSLLTLGLLDVMPARFVPIVVMLNPILLMVAFYGLACCATFIRAYRESASEEKRQIRWPLLGTMATLFVILLLSNIDYFSESLAAKAYSVDGSPSVLLKYTRSLVENFGFVIMALFYLLIPVSFTFAILKYRLMHIDIIIKKTFVYMTVTIIIIGLYFALVAGLGNLLVNYAGVKSQPVTIIATLAIAAVFVPVKNRVQAVADRRFFRKKYDYPKALKYLNAEIQDAADLSGVLKSVAEQLMQVLPNRALVIFLKGKSDQAFWAKEKIGVPDEIIDHLKFEPSSHFLSKLDGYLEPRKEALPQDEWKRLGKINSALIIPIRFKGELTGLISLGGKLSEQAYDEEDKNFLVEVAAQMAVGINSVRLREQEQEFEKARDIQQRLLPKEIPQLQGFEISATWQPAQAVSGDYYDVLQLSDSKLGLCNADVVGKGMPAALLMSNLQAAVKAFASDSVPPKELCEKVNRFLASNIASDKFITFFYGVLGAERKTFIYSRAGHNPPILIHQDGSLLHLEQGGPALGILADVKYRQEEIVLLSGDRILIFTDGVTEAMNPQNEEFGEERLNDLLVQNRKHGATKLQQCVMTAVADFTHGAFQDDVTMLVISVN